MMSQKMDRGKRGWMPPICWTFLLLLWASVACAKEDFNCHASLGGLQFEGESAVIIPSGDIEMRVGGPPTEVLCRFNSSVFNAEDMYFTTKEGRIESRIFNDSTIITQISHSDPKKYTLHCKVKRNNNKGKWLCSQTVKAGGLPLDITDLNCRADNNAILNCTWTIPYNPILTTYDKPTFFVDKFRGENVCPMTNAKSPYTFCYWDKGKKMLTREALVLHISGCNLYGKRNYSHPIDIMDVVYPSKVEVEVVLLAPRKVHVKWNLTHPIEVLPTGLFHQVEYRLATSQVWQNVTYFFHVNSFRNIDANSSFDIEETLPYANTEYVFRVRVHSAYEKRKQDLWSPFDLIKIKTGQEVPAVAPKTLMSTFETEEVLDSRDIYVNYQAIDSLDYGGDHFKYDVKVFSEAGDRITPLDKEPDELTGAFFKFKKMNFSAYRFQITPVNDVGPALVHSEVYVPKSDCLPKKTKMMTVITKVDDVTNKKTFSLYWIPSLGAKDHCPGAGPKINSYTIFWCQKANGDRCRRKLHWLEVTELDLVVKDLSEYTLSNITIYEKNITDLDPDLTYSFGIAANNGPYSSGIRWASCIVYDRESPNPPDRTEVTDDIEEPTIAIVQWTLKCPQISAIPLGYNISYCKSTIADFGHCDTKVEHVIVNSPSASSETIHDLDAGYTYIFSVSILSLIGEGKQSIPIMMKLRDNIPNGPPTNVTIDNSQTTWSTIFLTWEPPLVHKRRGMITHYDVHVTEYDDYSGNSRLKEAKAVDSDKDEPNSKKQWKIRSLRPYTNYSISIESCTNSGCAVNYPATVTVRTKSRKPSVIRDFEIDVSNWRLSWTPNRCDSVECFYEITSNELVNNTKLNVSVSAEKLLQLSDEGLVCNYTEMTFTIREVGLKEDGSLLYGDPTQVTKQADLCPSDWLSWWALFLIITCGFLVALLLFIAGRIGYGNIRNTIKDCYQNINLTKGIQAATVSNKEIRRKEFPPDMGFQRTSDAFLADKIMFPVNNSFTLDDKLLNRDTRSSVSSEEVHLIDVDGDRHTRNMSGSSDQSSAQDSALTGMSGSPSVVDTDHDAMSAELGLNQQQETMLRLRSTGPAYVQHGAMLEKLSEGYVTAHSVPSLPHLYKDGYISTQQSTPNLNGTMQLTSWQNARRASTGYISMPDSELESPKDQVTLPRGPMTRTPGFPPYSRYGFSTNMKPELINAVSPIAGLPHAGYVAICDMRPPSPPSSGYVAAGELLKRPPSLPLITKGGEALPLGAYCKIASNSAAAPGYVSAGPADNVSMPVRTDISPASKNPYVSYEAALMSVGRPDNSGPIPPYVELSDASRWATPMNRIPTALSSAPAVVENGRVTRIGQMPRPNTTEATIGHRTKEGSPTLSKQSSGYVSQETIPHCDSVLMSPKKLLSQSSVPHTVLMSPSHQASMV